MTKKKTKTPIKTIPPTIFDFKFSGDPVPASRVRHGKNSVFTPARYRNYKSELAKALKSAWNREEAMSGHMIMAVQFYRQTRRKVDIDNLMKAVMDALQDAGVITDDSDITVAYVIRSYSLKNPRTELHLSPCPMADLDSVVDESGLDPNVCLYCSRIQEAV